LKLTVAAVLAVGVAVLLVGCRDSSLPSAPSDLTSGVVVFEHANFLGRSARATIYRDSNFKGQSVDLTSDAANLQLVAGTCSHDGLNDCVSSIRVARQ
jgi:hypothetical protein